MTYNTLDNLTDVGLQTVLNYPNLETPIFWTGILFAIFVIITSLTFFRESARETRGNLFSSLAVAGYATTALATILSLLRLVESSIVITILVISLVFQTIFIVTKSR